MLEMKKKRCQESGAYLEYFIGVRLGFRFSEKCRNMSKANQLEDAASFTLFWWNVCLLEWSAEAPATDCQLGDWI